MYAIKKNDMTLYFTPNSTYYHNLDFQGFMLDNKPDTMFTKDVLSDTLKNTDYTYITIQDYVLRRIIEDATKQMITFINDKQGNTNFYYDNEFFEQNLGNMTALVLDIDGNCHIIPHVTELRGDYENILKGTFKLHLNGKRCVFDFSKNDYKITNYFDNKPISAINTLFTEDEIFIQLAKKQHQIGCSSPAFNEIVNLNEFLKHRKSIQVHLKNGEQFTIKKGTSYNSFLDASNVLSFYNNTNRFYIRKYSQYIKSSLEKDIDVNEIDYLQYHQRKHTINVYNLEDII